MAVATLAALALAGAGTAVAFDSIGKAQAASEQARSDSQALIKKNQDIQDKLYADQKTQSDKAAADAAAAESKVQADQKRDADRQKQKMTASGAQGRQSTILTSPLGVPAPYQTSGKTLLGT